MKLLKQIKFFPLMNYPAASCEVSQADCKKISINTGAEPRGINPLKIYFKGRADE